VQARAHPEIKTEHSMKMKRIFNDPILRTNHDISMQAYSDRVTEIKRLRRKESLLAHKKERQLWWENLNKKPTSATPEKIEASRKRFEILNDHTNIQKHKNAKQSSSD
jgi:hypothetical protein